MKHEFKDDVNDDVVLTVESEAGEVSISVRDTWGPTRLVVRMSPMNYAAMIETLAEDLRKTVVGAILSKPE